MRFYTWKKKFAGMGVREVRRLKQLEEENRKLKQLVADLSLDKAMLQVLRRGVMTPGAVEGSPSTMDFMSDQLFDGRNLRVLTIVDNFTRESLAVEVEHRMPTRVVCRTLLGLFAKRGKPEFVAKALMRMLADEKVEVKHIEPGSPWQNGRNERFNGSLRDECLNLETFEHRDQARARRPRRVLSGLSAVCEGVQGEASALVVGVPYPGGVRGGKNGVCHGVRCQAANPKGDCISELANGGLYVRVASTEGAGQMDDIRALRSGSRRGVM